MGVWEIGSHQLGVPEQQLRVEDMGPGLSVLLSNPGSWAAKQSSCEGQGWKHRSGMLEGCGDAFSLTVGVFLQALHVAGEKTGVGFPAFSLPGLGDGGKRNLDVWR